MLVLKKSPKLRMTPSKYVLISLMLSLALLSTSARADVLVLKTGKTFEVEKVWRENDQIWIIFHGMRAKIPKTEVERIETKSQANSGIPPAQKNESRNLKTKTAPMPPMVPRRQTKSAVQTAEAPSAVRTNTDKDLIFPDTSLGHLKWGIKRYALKGLEKIHDTEGQNSVVEYRQENKKLKLGQAALSSIDYAFWRDRLYMLTIRTQGRSNYIALRSEVFRQFGQGQRPDQPDERYLWTEAPNDMMLQYLKDGQQGLLWLRSCEIDRQYKLSRMSGYASYLQWLKSRN